MILYLFIYFNACSFIFYSSLLFFYIFVMYLKSGLFYMIISKLNNKFRWLTMQWWNNFANQRQQHHNSSLDSGIIITRISDINSINRVCLSFHSSMRISIQLSSFVFHSSLSLLFFLCYFFYDNKSDWSLYWSNTAAI